MKKYFVIIAILLGTLSVANAQRSERVIERLEIPDPHSNAWAVVLQKGSVGSVVRSIEERREGALRATQNKVNGYRVCIFLDNSQVARAEANTTRSKFRELFPETPVYLDYENPYWKVTVGDCITNEEAIVLWGRVKNTFGNAFVKRERIDISNFGESSSLE